jgi:Flp pilus assembly protein TadD
LKIRTRKKPARGSVEKVRESDLGHGRQLVVHKLTPPQDPEILSAMERAVEYAGTGRKDDAAEIARAVWRRDPEDKFVAVWAGQMLARYGSREEAVAVYCESEGVPPGSADAYWMLGNYLGSIGEPARAAEYLEEAVRIAPECGGAHAALARCLQELGRTVEARRHLFEARRLDPKGAS